MPRLKKVTALFLLLLVGLGLNFHLFALQLYGWSDMILDYRATSDSWAEAAAKTVSGDAPCPVCRHVEAAMMAREKSEPENGFVSALPFQLALFLPLFGGETILPAPDRPASALPVAQPAPATLPFPPAAPPPRV